MREAQLPEHILSTIERDAPWDLNLIEASLNVRLFPVQEVEILEDFELSLELETLN